MEWKDVFRSIIETHDFSGLEAELEERYASGKVFPPREQIYTAFELGREDSTVIEEYLQGA